MSTPSSSDDDVDVVHPAPASSLPSPSTGAAVVTESILPPVTSRSSKRPLSLRAPTGPDDQTFTAFLHDEVGITRPFVVAEAPGSWSVKDLVWKHDTSGRARTQCSPLWGLVDVYVLEGSNDVYVRCKVCALDGVETYLFLHGGQT